MPSIRPSSHHFKLRNRPETRRGKMGSRAAYSFGSSCIDMVSFLFAGPLMPQVAGARLDPDQDHAFAGPRWGRSVIFRRKIVRPEDDRSAQNLIMDLIFRRKIVSC